MSTSGASAPAALKSAIDPSVLRWMARLRAFARDSAYAFGVGVAALATIVSLPGTAPTSDPTYAALSLALFAGLLLTIRLAPDRPPSALVLVPAMAVNARLGLAALPALAYLSILVSLIRGQRGPRVVSGAAHQVLAFAAAHMCAQVVPILPQWVVFAVVFAAARTALWEVAARLDSARVQPREEKPDILLSLPLAPVGLLPLVAGDRLGDGALLLGTAALLALLFVVRESANLAAARAEMEAERDKLIRANALQDELIHLITHELRNPLTLIMSYSQMTRRAADEQTYDQVPTYVSQVERAGRSIQRLMENLLQLSKLERSDELPSPEPVHLGSVINHVLADLSPLARQKSQVLTAEPATELEPALAVPLLLREALSNLVSNAVKYTPEGGAIRIWTEGGRKPHTVVLGVRDTGIGLSKDDQTRLFTKFFRSSDPNVQRERGTGLGLALTHALITRMGGSIGVESEQGRGTTFRLTLPSAGAAQGSPAR